LEALLNRGLLIKLILWIGFVAITAPINSGWSQTSHQSPDANLQAERFLVGKLYRRLIDSPDLPRQFQMALKYDHPTLPELTINSGATDCLLFLVVALDEKDYPKKWDGSLEPNAPSAFLLSVNLRTAIVNATRRYYQDGRGYFEIKFDVEKNPYQVRLRYGNSRSWEPQRQDNPFQSNPFFGFVGGPSLTFEFSEDEAETAVTSLKTIFGKCG
jgi:hypothetical protein